MEGQALNVEDKNLSPASAFLIPHSVSLLPLAKRLKRSPSQPSAASDGNRVKERNLMAPIYYKAPDVLHWLDEGGKASTAEGKRKFKETSIDANLGSIGDAFHKVARAAKDLGKGAIADMTFRHLEEKGYTLYEDAFEFPHQGGVKRVAYSEIREIKAEPDDKFTLLYNGSSLTIKPIAHLVAGHTKVPIGWNRGGMEVRYAMLIEEIAARSRQTIVGL